MPGEAQRVIGEFWRIQDDGDYTRLVDLFAEDALLEDPDLGAVRRARRDHGLHDHHW